MPTLVKVLIGIVMGLIGSMDHDEPIDMQVSVKHASVHHSELPVWPLENRKSYECFYIQEVKY